VTGAILFLALPMVVAGVAYLLRGWQTISALLAAGTSLALGLMLILIPFDQPVVLFGREMVLGGAVPLLGRQLVLGSSARGAMAFLFLTGASLFLLAWRLEPEGLFPPLGLGLLALLSGALLVRPLIYAVLLLQIGVALSIFPLHADPRSPVRGGLLYLTFFTLALPGLLVSHWLLDMYALTPDQTGLLYTATALIGLSFALMLGVAPFHPWVPAVGRDGAPLASAFLFSATAGTVWFLLLDYLQSYPWLVDYPQWSSVLTVLGVATVAVGGLLGAARRGIGALLGYTIIVDTGMLLVALGQSRRSGLDLGIAMVFARTWGVALMAAGLAGLRGESGATGRSLEGRGLQAPWSTAAFTLGVLSLVGFPPTVGFAPRWGLYRILFRAQPVISLLLLFLSAGPLVGWLRQLYLLLRRPSVALGRDEKKQEERALKAAESPLVVLLLILFIAGAVGFGLFPQALTAAAAKVGESFTLFAP